MNVDVEVRLGGERRYIAAIEILDALCRITDQCNEATVEMAGTPAPSTEPTTPEPTTPAPTTPAQPPTPAGLAGDPAWATGTSRAITDARSSGTTSPGGLAGLAGSAHVPPMQVPLGPVPFPTDLVPPVGGAIQIMPDSRTVLVDDQPVGLTRVEFDLLAFLAEHPRRVFSRTQLLRSVWGYEHAGERTVDVHVRRLRSKLGDTIVTTVRSIGYRMSDSASMRVVRLS